jgi:hypothetical protein
MIDDDVFYSLTVEDIQNVAKEEIGRRLTKDEIKQLIDPISESIPWYDIIETAIKMHIAYDPDDQIDDE